MTLQENQKVLILDEHYFAFSALFTVGLQLSFFAVAYLCKFDLLTDFAAALNKCILAILTLILGGTFYPRQIVLTVMLLLCRVELGLSCCIVCARVRKIADLTNCVKTFPFLGFWVYQMIWVFATIAPVIFVNGDNRTQHGMPLTTSDGLLMLSVLCRKCLLTTRSFVPQRRQQQRHHMSGIWKYSRHRTISEKL